VRAWVRPYRLAPSNSLGRQGDHWVLVITGDSAVTAEELPGLNHITAGKGRALVRRRTAGRRREPGEPRAGADLEQRPPGERRAALTEEQAVEHHRRVPDRDLPAPRRLLSSLPGRRGR
jgi:hypothetical protein